jgi:hypothetical protein
LQWVPQGKSSVLFGLNARAEKRQFVEHVFKKMKRFRSRSSWKDDQYFLVETILNARIVIETGKNFTGIADFRWGLFFRDRTTLLRAGWV